MQVEVIVPDFGGTEEITLAAWLKSAGQRVVAGEVVAEVLTEKVNTEIVAPVSGILEELMVSEGQPVSAGQAIAVIVSDG